MPLGVDEGDELGIALGTVDGELLGNKAGLELFSTVHTELGFD